LLRVILAERSFEGRCLTKDGRGVFYPTAALLFRSGKIADTLWRWLVRCRRYWPAGLDRTANIARAVAPASRSQCGVADCCVAAKGAFSYW